MLQQLKDMRKAQEKLDEELREESKAHDKLLELAYECNDEMNLVLAKGALVMAALAANELERGNPLDNGVRSSSLTPASHQTRRPSNHDQGHMSPDKRGSGFDLQ